MNYNPPTNFSVVLVDGQKVFKFDKNPDAVESVFHIDIHGSWEFLGETSGDSFPVDNNLTGIYRSKGKSTLPTLPPPPPPAPTIADVDFGT